MYRKYIATPIFSVISLTTRRVEPGYLPTGRQAPWAPDYRKTTVGILRRRSITRPHPSVYALLHPKLKKVLVYAIMM